MAWSALQRLHTWYQSSFVSPIGTNITGDHLIREASKKVSQLVELTKNASKDDSTLLYWLLEDVLGGTLGTANKSPQTQHVSWHKLAFKYPPLIFAVGEVDSKLIIEGDFPLRWTRFNPGAMLNKSFNLKTIFHSHPAYGGIVGGRDEIKRWFTQAQSFYRATLDQTDDRVVFGSTEMDSECSYEVVQCNKDEMVSYGIFASCQGCLRIRTHRCLHYIQ